jgi:type II secretory pathway component PulK
LPAGRAAAVLDTIRRGRPFRNVLDFYLRSSLTVSEFQAIEDQLTTTSAAVVPGLINVNTASAEVLECLPGLEASDVSALLAARMGGQANLDSLLWVAQALPAEKASAIGGLITIRSYQFSADIVSVAGDGRAFRRCRIVVDARSSPPKVISRQDLTPLGWPLAPEMLTRLRAGASLEEIASTYAPGREGR